MKKIAILLPCFNENSGIEILTNHLVSELEKLPFLFELIYIDDGSLDDTKTRIESLKINSPSINAVLLALNFNVGHQKAIQQGLLFVETKKFDNVIIMDADGEDDPGAIQEILKHTDKDLVQVIRGKRNENWRFKFFYRLYQNLFKVVIGKRLNFGNFCMLSPKLVTTATENSFVHLAAFLDNQKCFKTKVTWDRSHRISGESKMGFKNLFYHAVNSFVENAQSLLFIFIKLCMFLILGIIILTGFILYKKYVTNVAVPGWSSTLMATLFNSLLISIGVFVLGSLQLNILNKQTASRKVIYFTDKQITTNW
ncbi:Glycosyltransferase involved in cell wall bisynthesis [Bizionia echini]|uniref:Glycosyltransferase involved in cell wall bisynthesis n=1 Tax=Bizionia echini TaxID=649333 RepID=A0A1I5D6S2_9FLAO|nr:glycosyltransferase [Bizionia echini]SFN94847.1 Glycosyltransferase involved in cell wall bisynthesis [Bizionia echini]